MPADLNIINEALGETVIYVDEKGYRHAAMIVGVNSDTNVDLEVHRQTSAAPGVEMQMGVEYSPSDRPRSWYRRTAKIKNGHQMFGGAGGVTKTDNNPQALKAKVAIRRNVLNAIGTEAAVFDAFAGSGQMFSAVQKDAGGYVGCDLKRQQDGRLMFCADNRRVLRAVDLARYSIFDFDAYGSPWEQTIILSDRRRVAPGALLGLILTEGAGLSYKANVVPTAITLLTGLRAGIVGLGKKQDAVIDRAIAGLARRMNCTIEKRWQADGKTGTSMRYIGLVLKGRG